MAAHVLPLLPTSSAAYNRPTPLYIDTVHRDRLHQQQQQHHQKHLQPVAPPSPTSSQHRGDHFHEQQLFPDPPAHRAKEMSRTAPALPHHSHPHPHQPLGSSKPPPTVPGAHSSPHPASAAAAAGGGAAAGAGAGEMHLPPIRPLGQRYDGSPMPSFRNVAHGSGSAFLSSQPQPQQQPQAQPQSQSQPQAQAQSQPQAQSQSQPQNQPRPPEPSQEQDQPPPPKKRARKAPAPLPVLPPSASASLPHPHPQPTSQPTQPTDPSRAARDTARKVNHSRIEKRRRERINDALSALRRLVPREEELERMQRGDEAPFRSEEAADRADAAAALAAAGKGKGKGKEFKLEVLDRTVAYVRFLINRLRESEGAVAGALAAGAVAPLSTLKRKREDSDEEEGDMSDESDDGEEEDEDEEEEDEEEEEEPPRQGTNGHTRPLAPSSDSPPYPLLPTPTLPSWHARHAEGDKPHQHIRTSSARSLPVSPAMLLPSPPASGRQEATISPTSQPPVLRLPEPSLALPGRGEGGHREHREQQDARERRSHHNPAPARDGEEEAQAAASVLLQLKDPSPRIAPVDSGSGGQWRVPSLSPRVGPAEGYAHYSRSEEQQLAGGKRLPLPPPLPALPPLPLVSAGGERERDGVAMTPMSVLGMERRGW
ncbi:hypothetical protein CALVIDRAFT_528642 [Calocera viscosa TUFC12733]|uniref:BHLH domain-containing protein n=1 Tax=Calocera viscosa (strain TUFC12733) TaxID=1330018 RepID=A0A167KK19_CALVF|nr:hypothetical protein CALVIDRAFT_528642 [Calocera viscosa TUFC12733]